MTSRYRVEYALKTHKRDELIEWIKALLAVPFVLHGDVDQYEEDLVRHETPSEAQLGAREAQLEKTLQARYLEVFHDVEKLIDNTIQLDGEQDGPRVARTRLRQLVPTVGRFFTRLPLADAFVVEDGKRSISRRTLVSPSFNDIRMILNTAQVLALSDRRYGPARLRLVTFDGDVTLYDDGQCLAEDSPLVGHLVSLLRRDVYVAVVTAAGYPGQQGAECYHQRLHGLVATLRRTDALSPQQKSNFLVMGGESNYLFRYDSAAGSLRFIDGDEWYLPLMRRWSARRIGEIMDLAHAHLHHLRERMRLADPAKTTIIRKERSLGIVPVSGYKIPRETLEEMVLSVSQKLAEYVETSRAPAPAGAPAACAEDIRVCAFNGGADVWVDIGDKSLGVSALQAYLHKTGGDRISRASSLHVGDQFGSVGANDFKARLSACTVWIASPRETTDILDELVKNLGA